MSVFTPNSCVLCMLLGAGGIGSIRNRPKNPPLWSPGCRNSVCWLHMKNESQRWRSFSISSLRRKSYFTESFTSDMTHTTKGKNFLGKFISKEMAQTCWYMSRAEAKGNCGHLPWKFHSWLYHLLWKFNSWLYLGSSDCEERPLWSGGVASLEGRPACRAPILMFLAQRESEAE